MAVLVLDTDHLSLIQRSDSADGLRLTRRLEAAMGDEIRTTIVNYEEQTRGWLAYLAKARSVAEQVERYRRLEQHVEMYTRIPLLSFDMASATQFQSLQAKRLKVATMDLKIASIVLAVGGTLLTRNLSDFQRVPGLHCEDWTK
jgi:tRNA(fMet)-specific endonuclease VapC